MRIQADEWGTHRARLGVRCQVGDDDLRHFHHRGEGVLAVVAVEALECAGECDRNDLPTDTPSVFAPATHAFAATVVDDRVPDVIDVVLCFARHLKTDGFAVGELRPAVQCCERLAEEFEFDDENRALRPLCIGLVVTDVSQT